MKATINVNIPIDFVRKSIFEQLESMEAPVYRFIKMTSPIEGQFEVEDDGSHGDLCQYTKKIIYSTKFGKVIMFQVLYNGQFFDGGVIQEDLLK